MDSETVENFVGITGATPDQAKFFLSAAGGDIGAAVDQFFESGGAMGEEMEESAASPMPAASAVPAVSASSAAVPPRAQAVGRARAPPRGNVRGFSDLGGGDDSESDSDSPREYFTGGEKSGMMVQDPSKKQSSGDHFDALCQKARQNADAVGDDLLPSGSRPARAAFTGTARTLGSSGDDAAPPAPGPTATTAASNEPPQPVYHTVTFYNNGFTVNDGPLRKLDDPANRPFLTDIELGNCPKELAPPGRNTPVHVNLVRNPTEWEPPPVPKYVAFSGSGRTLGSAAAEEPPTAPPPAAAAAAAAATSAGSLEIDDSAPVTSLQLRLHDGTRLVARFNHTHTIGDIRGFINHTRPGSPATYTLMTSFPPKQLTDVAQTIADAGLVGAVVIQKL